MRKRVPRIAGAAVVAAVALCHAVTFVLREGEGALVVTFGRPASVLVGAREAGLHLAWPWPVQKVHRYDMREQLHEGRLEKVGTASGEELQAAAFVLWRVADPLRFHEASGGDASRAPVLISGPLRNAVAAVCARYAFDAICRRVSDDGGPEAGPAALGDIERDIGKALAASLEPYGIAVVQAGFFRLMVPEGAAEDVCAQMRRVKTEEAERIKAEGEARARAIRAEADREYEEITGAARIEADALLARAQADAAAELAAVGEGDLLTFLEELRAVEALFGASTTIVWAADRWPFTLLERLAEGGGGAARASGGDAAGEGARGGGEAAPR